MLDFSFKNNVALSKGKLLLSDPFSDEAYFGRSIVFLYEYSKDGAFGFVLNKLITVNLNEINNEFPNLEAQISIGGPVETKNLYFIHTLGDRIENSIPISKGVFIGGKFNQLAKLLHEDAKLINNIRFFIGYAGWSKGQLEEELEFNSWIVSSLKPIKQIFNIPYTQSWEKRMRKMGGKYKIMADSPVDPSHN